MLPLQGIKIIEIAQNLAGPYAGQILGTMGADVLKIERPKTGDDARGWGPPFHHGMATTFHAVNQNKRSITLDLKNPDDIAWLKARIGESDALVQNMRPGSLEELGLGGEELCAANPRLVYTSLWALGAKGPMRLNPGYEPMVQAFAGMFSLNGAPEGPPSRVGWQVLDLGTGLWAALGTVAALFRRGITGKGGIVDTSLLETALGWMSVHFAGFAETRKMPTRDRSGNPKVVVFGALPTADRELVVAAANDRLFAKLVTELGHPEWATDPRFLTNADRVAHRDLILGWIGDIMRTKSSGHWLERMEALGIPAAPINDMSNLLVDAQVAALDIIKPPPGFALPLVGFPMSFDGERPAILRAAPALGEHNDEVKGE
jgi:crotonobetainyl-CoA:carnitine CoA-transferase CaiB-like acyl-CoA transferase